MDIGNVIAAVVVLAVLGAVFGFILAVASKVFEVKKDPREEEILIWPAPTAAAAASPAAPAVPPPSWRARLR